VSRFQVKGGIAVYRVSRIIGKIVVLAETGDRLGSVSDALLEDGGRRIVGLVLGSGLLAKQHVMPFDDVQAVGGDAVLARTDAGIVGPREWRKSGVRTMRSSELRGREVVTAGGERLGTVSDLLVNEKTGAFDAVEVAWRRRLAAGLRSRHSLVPASRDFRIGPHVVIVPDGVLGDRGDGSRAP
jgi:sporulation protein YlmC with PRC-barrel domain